VQHYVCLPASVYSCVSAFQSFAFCHSTTFPLCLSTLVLLCAKTSKEPLYPPSTRQRVCCGLSTAAVTAVAVFEDSVVIGHADGTSSLATVVAEGVVSRRLVPGSIVDSLGNVCLDPGDHGGVALVGYYPAMNASDMVLSVFDDGSCRLNSACDGSAVAVFFPPPDCTGFHMHLACRTGQWLHFLCRYPSGKVRNHDPNC